MFLFVFSPALHWFLFSVELFGILIVNSIFVAVVTNYYTQCEMILFYVKGVAFKLQEKSIDLKTAMKVNNYVYTCLYSKHVRHVGLIPILCASA